MVEHLVWDQGVASSNLVTSIFLCKNLKHVFKPNPFGNGLKSCFFDTFFLLFFLNFFPQTYRFLQKTEQFCHEFCHEIFLYRLLLSFPAFFLSLSRSLSTVLLYFFSSLSKFLSGISFIRLRHYDFKHINPIADFIYITPKKEGFHPPSFTIKSLSLIPSNFFLLVYSIH